MPTRTFKHLTLQARYHIQTGLANRLTPAQLARQLGVDQSTIRRERARGCVRVPAAAGAYQAEPAHALAVVRRKKSAANAVRIDARILPAALALMRTTQAGPRQIVKRLPHLGLPACSAQTLYNQLHRLRRQGRADACDHLRQAAKQAARWRLRTRRRANAQGPARMRIDQRPRRVYRRGQLGHWEADTMHGKAGQRRRVLIVVERKSRYVLLQLLAQATGKALTRRLQGLARRHRQATTGAAGAGAAAGREPSGKKPPGKLLRTLTCDNGSEFDGWQTTARALRIKVYFAYPMQPTQRATCENTVGLVRQYLPKGKSLEQLTACELKRIEQRLNNRPRVCLDGLTPYEVLFGQSPRAFGS
jgi:transposase, IS30 family